MSSRLDLLLIVMLKVELRCIRRQSKSMVEIVMGQMMMSNGDQFQIWILKTIIFII